MPSQNQCLIRRRVCISIDLGPPGEGQHELLEQGREGDLVEIDAIVKPVQFQVGELAWYKSWC